MKLILKILFFLLAICYTNISEARVIVFDVVVSEIKISLDDLENKSKVATISENDFATTCKNPDGADMSSNG